MDFEYERHLGFTSRGEIFVRNDTGLNDSTRKALQLAIDDQPDGTGTRLAILNLNHPALVAARQAAIDSERTRIEKNFEGRMATREDREQRVQRLLEANPMVPFVSVRVCWLRKILGKGK